MPGGGRMSRRMMLCAALAGALALAPQLTLPAGASPPPVGALTQLPGTLGCFTFDGYSEDGIATCTPARGVAEGESAIVSPDGAYVYAGSYRDPGAKLGAGVAIFSRNSLTGALTQLASPAGCLTADGSSVAGPGTCTKARALEQPGDGHDLAITADGRWAYLAAQNETKTYGGVLIFQRDPATGALTQLPGAAGCITRTGESQDGVGTCQPDATLLGPSGVTLSSDDRFLYLTDYDTPKRVHVFARDTSTGALSELQCISEAPAPPGCSTGRDVGNSEFLALSPDGTHAYSGDYQHGLSVLDRDPVSGLLTQKAGAAGCFSGNGLDDTGAATCAVGRVPYGTYTLLVSPNGQTLYDLGKEGVAIFHINADGSLTQLPGTAGCITLTGEDNTKAMTCAVGRAVAGSYGGALSPDGLSLYVSENDSVGGVGVFSLNPATGVATQLPGLLGCVTSSGGGGGTPLENPGECATGTGLETGYGMSVSPDGAFVYQATDRQSLGGHAIAGLAVYARQAQPFCSATSRAVAFQTPTPVRSPARRRPAIRSRASSSSDPPTARSRRSTRRRGRSPTPRRPATAGPTASPSRRATGRITPRP